MSPRTVDQLQAAKADDPESQLILDDKDLRNSDFSVFRFDSRIEQPITCEILRK